MQVSKLRTAIFTVAALVATVGTITLNVAHGWLVGGLTAAIVFGAIDTFKVLVIAARRWTLSYIPLALAGLALALISTLAITDFFAERLGANAADEVAASTLKRDTYEKRQLIVDEMKSLADERKTVSWSIRTSEQVKAEIEAKKLDPLWTATSECTTNLSGLKSRTLCAVIARLRSEAEGAKRSEELSAKQNAAREKLLKLSAAPPLEARDRMSRLCDKLKKIDKYPTHQLALALALIVEALTIFFPMVVWKQSRVAVPSDNCAPVAAPAAAGATATHPSAAKVFPTKAATSGKSKPATPSATVLAFRRQPLAVVGNPSAATPASSSAGNPLTLQCGNPSTAPPLATSTATPGNSQQTLALAGHATAAATPIGSTVWQAPVADAGNPLRSRVEAEADLLGLLRRGNPLPSQMKLAERWGVNPGTASKWVSRMEEDGVIVVARRPDGSKHLALKKLIDPSVET